VTCHPRLAAYVVVRDRTGRVAAVRSAGVGPARFWLPGGESHPGEPPELTVAREVREEVGHVIRLAGRIGDAVQIFHAATEQRWYEMKAAFFRFFHACHAWAVSQA